MRKSITIYIDEGLIEAAADFARRKEMSTSELVETLLRCFFDSTYACDRIKDLEAMDRAMRAAKEQGNKVNRERRSLRQFKCYLIDQVVVEGFEKTEICESDTCRFKEICDAFKKQVM